ncbi:hypothetical protein ACI8AF_21880 [Blastococcus sp. SYSU D00669]
MTAVERPLAAPVRAAVLGRVAAALAVASAVVHLLLLDAGSLGSLVMLAMALVCLPCAWHLWRHPTATTWGLTAAVDGAMLLLHAQMLSTVTHHAHTTAGPLMWTGLALVTGQLALAGVAAVRR